MGNELLDNNLQLSSLTFDGSGSGFFVDGSGAILNVGARPGLFKRTLNSGRDHSVLINTLYEVAYRIRRNAQEAAEETGGGSADREERGDSAAAWEASEQGTIALIKKWQAELAEKGIPFDVVIIDRPWRAYNKFELRFLEDLQAACDQNHSELFRFKLDGDPYEFYSFDGIALGHFNEKGHETAASQLHEFFQSRHKAIFKS